MTESNTTLFESNYFADVILPVPLAKLFTYRVPSEMIGYLAVGSRIIVPFGKKKVLTGIVGSIHETPPEAIQCVVNPLNSAGAIGYVDKDYDPNNILEESQEADIPILGIRAVQAGALTSKMDRKPHESGRDIKDFEDYDKAEPFRNLATEWGMTPSSLAHRYALSAEKVSSVILGVKNREELLECLEAEAEGLLFQDQINEIDKVFSN